MIHTRRKFLGMASTLLATSATAPAFLTRAAFASAGKEPQNDRVLVVVQLTGGNDGLNTVVPFTDENYRRLRPTLSLADAKLHKLDDRIGLHPSLLQLAKVFENQQAAVVQSVGYPHANRSHFESMAIWHTAPDDAQLGQGRAAQSQRGWIARAIDERMSVEEQSRAAAGLRFGGGEMPQAMLGCRVPLPSLADLEQLKRRGGLLDPSSMQAQAAGWKSSADASANPLLAAAEASALGVQATAKQIESLDLGTAGGSGYPYHPLGGRLRSIAQLLSAGFPASIYFTELGGFDTHSRQANNHANLLGNLAASLKAFVEDVQKNAPSRPVLVLVFSEFGRRVEENASQGTDHGTAAPVFLVGDGVIPGVHGAYPDLANLVDGDPVFSTDFRALYATILERWLGLPSAPILGQQFETLKILNGATA